MRWLTLLGLWLGLCFVGLQAHAQASCPPGQIPYGTGNGPNMCGPDNSQRPRPQAPTAHWEDRWGALATVVVGSVLGVAVNMPTEQAAAQAALNDCRAKGGDQCMVNTYKNGCAALIGSDTNAEIVLRPSLEAATSDGLHKCISAGLQGCNTFYSACSPSVLVRDR